MNFSKNLQILKILIKILETDFRDSVYICPYFYVYEHQSRKLYKISEWDGTVIPMNAAVNFTPNQEKFHNRALNYGRGIRVLNDNLLVLKDRGNNLKIMTDEGYQILVITNEVYVTFDFFNFF